MRCRYVVSAIVKVPMKHETSGRRRSNDSSGIDGRQAVPSLGSSKSKIRGAYTSLGLWGVEMQFVGADSSLCRFRGVVRSFFFCDSENDP